MPSPAAAPPSPRGARAQARRKCLRLALAQPQRSARRSPRSAAPGPRARPRPASRPAPRAPAPLPRAPRAGGSRAPAPPRPGRPRAGSGRSRGSSGCAGRRPAHRAPWRTASARMRAQLGRRVLAQRDRDRANRSASGIRTQAREPAADPLRHFGRARLGEGEAQDRAGIDAAQQQPQHARRQHLRLAGAGRGRQPDMRVGRAGRAPARRSSGGSVPAAMPAHGHTIRRGASAGHIRHRAHIRGASLAVNGSSPVSQSADRLGEMCAASAVNSSVGTLSRLPAGSTGDVDIAEAVAASCRATNIRTPPRVPAMPSKPPRSAISPSRPSCRL